jgi:uncharacterized membrane protein YecN with MAPEG domain
MLQITLITTALLALANIWIGWRVGQVRMKEKVSLGDDGRPALIARMRAHANFSEYVPLVVLLMGLIEMAGGARSPLTAAGWVIVLARIAHALGMDRPAPNPFRMGGTLGTILVTLALAGWALGIAYR